MIPQSSEAEHNAQLGQDQVAIKNLSARKVMKQATMERVADVVDRAGRFQIALLFLISVNSAIVGFNHTLTTFHSYTPNFYCRDDNANTSGCVSENTTCQKGYEFEQDDHTLVSEWELVCSRVLLKPLVSTLYFSGVTVGALVFGILTDKFGRRLMMIICLYSQCIFGISSFGAQTLTTFIILRTIQGFFVQGLQSTSFTLMLEFCPTRQRTGAGVLWEIFWAIGCAILGGLAYAIADWRWLQIALAIPSVATLTYIWIIPESAFWLTTVGKFQEAEKVCDKILKLNGFKNQTTQKVAKSEFCEKKEDSNDSSSISSEKKTKTRYNSLLMFKSKLLRKFGLVMIFVWFSVTITYYGLLFHLPSLYGQRHVNFVIGAAIEVVAYLISYWLMSTFGRNKPLIYFQILSGVICAAVAIILYTDASNHHIFGPLMTFLVLVSKGCAVSSFCCMFIYTTELFPTVVRGIALGVCGFSCRVGSLLSPQIIVLGEYTHPALPLTLLGVFNFAAGLTTIALPETLGITLPNSIEDAEETFLRKKEPNIVVQLRELSDK